MYMFRDVNSPLMELTALTVYINNIFMILIQIWIFMTKFTLAHLLPDTGTKLITFFFNHWSAVINDRMLADR